MKQVNIIKLRILLFLLFMITIIFIICYQNNIKHNYLVNINKKLRMAAVQKNGMKNATKLLNISEYASFKFYQDSLPNYDQIISRPSILESYAYAGLGVWCSRGVSLPRAISAMLGDTGVVYESPLFTLFRAQILELNIADLVYDSNMFQQRIFGGYNHFITNVVPRINAIKRLKNLGYSSKQIHEGRKNDSLASEMAKHLIGLHFFTRLGCKKSVKCMDKLPNFSKTFLSNKGFGTRSDTLWTTPFLRRSRVPSPCRRSWATRLLIRLCSPSPTSTIRWMVSTSTASHSCQCWRSRVRRRRRSSSTRC